MEVVHLERPLGAVETVVGMDPGILRRVGAAVGARDREPRGHCPAVGSAHLALGETTGAASAYVGMTRGRHHNVAHLVAESADDARTQWVDVFNRDRADPGPNHAAERAADDIDRYGPSAPPPDPEMQTGLQAAALRNGPRRPPQPTPTSPPTSRGIGR